MLKNTSLCILFRLYISFQLSKGWTENKTIVGHEHEVVILLYNGDILPNQIVGYTITVNDIQLIRIIYSDRTVMANSTIQGVDFAGDVTKGNLSIRIASMNVTFEGICTLHKFTPSPEKDVQFVELYMRARPNQPIISKTVLDENGRIPGVEDKEVRITCTSTGGYPKPNMAWYKTSNQLSPLVDNANKEEQVDRNYTLTYTFKPNRADDGKLFICQISYGPLDPLHMNDSSVLYLSLKPSKPSLAISKPVNEIQSPVEIAICASAGFRPEAIAVSWVMNGNTTAARYTVVPNNGTFGVSSRYQRSVSRELNGKALRCVVNHTTLDAPLESTGILDVQFKPLTVDLIANADKIVANGNNRVKLNCTSGSSNPNSTILWYRNNKVINNGATIHEFAADYNGMKTSQLLDFVAERDMDGDEILCTVHNDVDKQNPISSVVITLDLIFHPKTTVRAEDEVVEGSTITLRCNVNSKPESISSWSHNGTVLPPAIQVASNVFEYTISAVQRDQAGTYVCLAQNGHLPNGVSQTNLKVTYAPDVTVRTSNVTVNDNSTGITCIPSGIPSTYTYSEWQHIWPGHGIIQHINSLGSEPILSLSSLTYEYTGIYRCTVSNGVQGSLNPNAGQGMAYLEVKTFPIIITTGPIQIYASLNNTTIVAIAFYSNVYVNAVECFRSNLIIDCPTSMAEADIQLPVFGTPIVTKGIVANIKLTIQNLDQFGLFNVQITNVIGSSRMVIVDVIPKGPPESPSDVTIDEVLFNYVTMSWMPGCHGGFNQTFVIEYSTDGKEWLPEDKVERHGWKLDQRINGTISNLQEQSRYYFRIRSHNERGFSKYTDIINVTTEAYQGGVAKTTSYTPIIAGAVTAGCIFIIALSIGVLYWTRHKERGDSQHSETSITRRDATNAVENRTEIIQDYYNIDRNPYEDLQQSKEDVHEYGTLNLIEGSSNQPIGDTVYENLKLSPVK